jgi:hypothetical protein
MFEGLGIPDNVINEIFGQFNEMEANFEGRVFTATFSFPTIGYLPSGAPIRRDNAVIHGQHGGIFEPRPGGTFVNLAEAGSREALIPLNGEGIGILSSAMQQAGAQGGSAGGARTVINIGTVYGWDDFRRKVREAGVQNARLGV